MPYNRPVYQNTVYLRLIKSLPKAIKSRQFLPLSLPHLNP